MSALILTLSQVRAALTPGNPHRRVRITAARDPLRNLPRGDFSLDDFDYDSAGLCQNEFGNCAVNSLGVA